MIEVFIITVLCVFVWYSTKAVCEFIGIVKNLIVKSVGGIRPPHCKVWVSALKILRLRKRGKSNAGTDEI